MIAIGKELALRSGSRFKLRFGLGLGLEFWSHLVTELGLGLALWLELRLGVRLWSECD